VVCGAKSGGDGEGKPAKAVVGEKNGTAEDPHEDCARPPSGLREGRSAAASGGSLVDAAHQRPETTAEFHAKPVGVEGTGSPDERPRGRDFPQGGIVPPGSAHRPDGNHTATPAEVREVLDEFHGPAHPDERRRVIVREQKKAAGLHWRVREEVQPKGMGTAKEELRAVVGRDRRTTTTQTNSPHLITRGVEGDREEKWGGQPAGYVETLREKSIHLSPFGMYRFLKTF